MNPRPPGYEPSELPGCSTLLELNLPLATDLVNTHGQMATVQLYYFRPTGKLLAGTSCEIAMTELEAIWEEIHELRRMGRLPGLRPNAGRDLLVLVDVPDHPHRRLHLVIPPSLEEEDVTPIRVPTGDMSPLVGLPLSAMPRTSTRDVVGSSIGPEDVTPPDGIRVHPVDDYDE